MNKRLTWYKNYLRSHEWRVFYIIIAFYSALYLTRYSPILGQPRYQAFLIFGLIVVMLILPLLAFVQFVRHTWRLSKILPPEYPTATFSYELQKTPFQFAVSMLFVIASVKGLWLIHQTGMPFKPITTSAYQFIYWYQSRSPCSTSWHANYG